MHGLPTWQFVTIEHLTDSNSAIMELRPILNANSFNPLWAVANVRQCPTKGVTVIYNFLIIISLILNSSGETPCLISLILIIIFSIT